MHEPLAPLGISRRFVAEGNPLEPHYPRNEPNDDKANTMAMEVLTQSPRKAENVASHRMYSLREGDLPKFREALRSLLLEDPHTRAQYERGCSQYRALRHELYGEGRLMRPSDPQALLERLIPSAPEERGIEFPAVLASDLSLRKVIWNYLQALVARSNRSSERRAARLEYFRGMVLNLRGDYDEPRKVKSQPRVSLGGFKDDIAKLLKSAHSLIAREGRNRHITSELKRLAFRVLKRTLSQEQISPLHESALQTQRDLAEARSRLTGKEARTLASLKDRLEPILKRMPSRPSIPAALPTFSPHESLPRHEYQVKLPEPVFSDHPEMKVLPLEEARPGAVQTLRLRALPELSIESPSREEIASSTEKAPCPCFNILTSDEGAVFVRISGRLISEQSRPKPESDSIIEFELPVEFKNPAAAQRLSDGLKKNLPVDPQMLVEDPIANDIAQYLLSQGATVRRLENWKLPSRILSLSLAPHAVLKDIFSDASSVLRIRGDSIECNNVQMEGGVLDLRVKESMWLESRLSHKAVVRGSFGTALFDAVSELHCNAAEADLLGACFLGERIDERLEDLLVRRDAISASVLEELESSELSSDEYERECDRYDAELGAETLYNLLGQAPIGFSGREPLGTSSHKHINAGWYKLNVPDHDPQLPYLRLYIVPANSSALIPRCVLLRGHDEELWPENRQLHAKNRIHLYDALFMLMDWFFEPCGDPWWKGRIKPALREESGDRHVRKLGRERT